MTNMTYNNYDMAKNNDNNETIIIIIRGDICIAASESDYTVDRKSFRM